MLASPLLLGTTLWIYDKYVSGMNNSMAFSDDKWMAISLLIYKIKSSLIDGKIILILQN